MGGSSRIEPIRRVDDRTFRSLVGQVKDHAIFVLDLEGRNASWNEGVRSLFGYEEREWIGQPLEQTYPPEDVRDDVPRKELRLAARQGSASDDRWLVRKGGERFFASGTTTRLLDDAGRLLGYAKIVRDMTEQRRAEERVRSAEERVRLATEAAGVGCSWIRPNGEAELDARAAGFAGRPPEYFRTLEDCLSVVHPDDRELVKRTLEGALAEENPRVSAEYRVVRPDGEVRWLLAEGSAFYEGGEPAGITGVMLDLTEAKRATETMRLVEERLHVAQAAAGIATWDWNFRTRTVAFSPEWYPLHGLPPAEPFERGEEGWCEGMPPEDRDAMAREVLRAIESGSRSFEAESRVVWPDSSVHWLAIRGQIQRDERGEPERIVGVALDVTGEKELAQRIRQVQRVEAIGQLAGGVAHEVNNQMTVVLGLADLMMADPALLERFRADLGHVRSAAERSARVAEQMLAYSRRQVLRPEVLDLNAMLREQRTILQSVVGDERTLELRLTEPLGRVRADRVQLERAVTNLVVNARDATEPGGRITIVTRSAEARPGERQIGRPRDEAERGRFVRLSVEDTGHGMSPETMAHVFDPFFTTKAVGEGTGLGLSTVYGVVTQHGGHVSVESELGRGARFHIDLPEVEARPLAPETPSHERSIASSSLGRVLVVDDEPGVLDIAARVLASAGYEVLTARDGHEALESLRRGLAPDLVVTDLVMPRLSGAELARALSREVPDLPILTISGFADTGVRPEDGGSTVVGHLRKPFRPRELLDAVRGALAARGRRAWV